MSYSSFVPHYDGFPYALFEHIASDCANTDLLVEVGAFLGHGTCYMAECLVAYDKRPRFVTIDMWDEAVEPIYGENRTGDMPWGEPIAEWRARGGRLYDSFRFYLDNCPHKDRVYDHAQFPSAAATDEFKNDSVAFAWLAYSQTQEGIERDVKAWWPKIKSGGVLAIPDRLKRPSELATLCAGSATLGAIDRALYARKA